ncbi:MAG: SGNH/GDSL hydrolase family protein [Muribaculaceae bacterium]|nr:SGNH/GDSL hydrolase family protein [Muribaculaceae bacterium]
MMFISARNILLGAAAAVALSALAHGDDWANFRRYEKANAEVIDQPLEKRAVVFLGNSITENWARIHPEFFTSHGFVPRGISGQTSYQFLLRFRDDVISLHPSVVVINAGTNDVAENNHTYNEDRTFGNIVSMVELAQANGIKPVLSTVLPALVFGWRPEISDAPQKIKSLNKRLRAYAAAREIPFVDYYTPMALKETGALNPSMTDDGVHPTAMGYDVMEVAVLEVLSAMQPAKH